MRLSLSRVRAILSNHNVPLSQRGHPLREGCVMPTQSLPAPSLTIANCFPASRMLIREGNSLIYWVLRPIWRVISVVESIFLPESREAPGGSRRSAGGSRRSAGQALGAGRDVVEGERHRHA